MQQQAKPTARELEARVKALAKEMDEHREAFNAYRGAHAALRNAEDDKARAKAEATKKKNRKGHNAFLRAYQQRRALLKQ